MSKTNVGSLPNATAQETHFTTGPTEVLPVTLASLGTQQATTASVIDNSSASDRPPSNAYFRPVSKYL